MEEDLPQERKLAKDELRETRLAMGAEQQLRRDLAGLPMLSRPPPIVRRPSEWGAAGHVQLVHYCFMQEKCEFIPARTFAARPQ